MPRPEIRKTKIVCTIGPATRTPEAIFELGRTGMDVARLNFSHGDREEHRQTIRLIRAISKKLGKEIGILQDLGGPKIRLGRLDVPERIIHAGDEVTLAPGDRSSGEILPVTYSGLLDEVEVGDHILMADGTVELVVVQKQADRLVADAIVGGTVQSHKGVNLPSSQLKIPALTDKDRADLTVGLEEQVDFVALSFVRHETDLDSVHQVLDQMKRRPMLIAKIEKPQAVDRFDKILSAADGAMVARGDLGVEMPLEEVPLIQKRIIRTARQAGKPVITATQMLTSMMTSPRPTRAEATDVANAILDGTDALMLSDETAIGAYATQAVATLDRIARSTERHLDHLPYLQEGMSELLPSSTAGAISRAACLLAVDLRAAAIIASTSSGGTARYVARYRPRCPVVTLTRKIQTQRQLALTWGVIPDWVESFTQTDEMFQAARRWVLEKGMAHLGDRLVLTGGVPLGMSGTTNLLKVMELTESSDVLT
ncbi:MAG: pyruvate kinase [Syntrophobacteraceae bacterium]